PGRRRRRFTERPDGRDRDRGRIRRDLVRAARVLGDRPHRFRLRETGERREPAMVLDLGRPVSRDDQQRRARDLRVEQLSGELIRAAHHVRDDDTDLAADAVIAVGHRGHESFVLADDELLVAVLGQCREDPGLCGARIREEILDPRVLEGLDQQHAAGARDRLAHGLPRGEVPVAWALYQEAGPGSRRPESLPGTPRWAAHRFYVAGAVSRRWSGGRSRPGVTRASVTSSAPTNVASDANASATPSSAASRSTRCPVAGDGCALANQRSKWT